MTDRIKVTIRLSPQARRGYERAELASGASLTALIEAVGVLLETRDECPSREEVMELARRIDVERHSRRAQ